MVIFLNFLCVSPKVLKIFFYKLKQNMCARIIIVLELE